MFTKKNILTHLLSVCVLCIGLVLCRYVFFEMHGMKQLPVLLFGIGMFLVALSFFLKGKVIPICISFAYIVGFVAGVVFGTNGIDAGGGATNNLWIIWTVVFICCTVVGVISEGIFSAKK